MSANVLVLRTAGTNCDQEAEYAFRLAGARTTKLHVNALRAAPGRLREFHVLALPGGFSYGDDLGAGKVLANEMLATLRPALEQFLDEGKLIIGICNGFQVLVKLGLLPGDERGRQPVTLTNNLSGRFEDRWVRLRSDPASPCVFTRGVERIELPVRHGEGRVLGESPALLAALVERNRVPLRYADAAGTPTEAYPDNPNGSAHGIAALCNATGTVLGLMPHPEAFNHYTNHPRWTRRPSDGVADGNAPPPADEDGDGIALFRNAYAYLRG